MLDPLIALSQPLAHFPQQLAHQPAPAAIPVFQDQRQRVTQPTETLAHHDPALGQKPPHLIGAVRVLMSWARTRCSANRSCCSIVLTGTNHAPPIPATRMDGQIDVRVG